MGIKILYLSEKTSRIFRLMEEFVDFRLTIKCVFFGRETGGVADAGKCAEMGVKFLSSLSFYRNNRPENIG
jgi:hypothetical protein